MEKNSFAFNNIIEDESLSILAVHSKELIQLNDEIVNIFNCNNETLYGESPRQVLYLMKQNNKSVFSSSPINPINESSPTSNQGLSTPVKRNPDIPNISRRQLQLDAAEKNVPKTGTEEDGCPIKRQTVIVSPQKQPEQILVSSDDDASTSAEQIVSPFASPSCPSVPQQGSPRSAEITKMTANLTMGEKEFRSPIKVTGNLDARNPGSRRSLEVTKMVVKHAMCEKDFGNPEKLSSDNYTHKKFRNLVREQMASDSGTNIHSLSPEENTGKSDSTDSTNKHNINEGEGMGTISKPTIIDSETPSPVKRSRMCSISPSDSQEFSSPAEKLSMAGNSPEDTKVFVSPVQGDKMKISSSEDSMATAIGDRKRKSFSPKRKMDSVFSSIPRIIQHDGKSEIDVEVSCDFKDNASPSTSQSSPSEYLRDLLKESLRGPVGFETKTDSSPKSLEWYLTSTDQAIFTSFSRKVSATSSPESHKDALAVKCSSEIPSVVETRDCVSESSSAFVEIDTVALTRIIMKFNMLSVMRDRVMKINFNSLLMFGAGLLFTSSYIEKLVAIVLQIDVAYKEYSVKELKETVNDITGIVSKLRTKLASWKRDVDLDVNTWRKCLQQIHRLRTQYEPLLSKEGKPAVTSDVVQVYEYELKAIWRKLDDMIMMLDSKKALFAHIAYDVSRLMKMFFNCLIHVGILHPC